MALIPAIKSRRSVRQYSAETVPESDLKEVLRAGVYAPSSADRRPVHFVVVKDKEVKRKLSEATAWSKPLANAAAVIVVCADMAKGKRWVEDCSIAGEHLMLQAAELGLGTCWIQVREGDPPASGADPEESVKKTLAIPKSYRVLCAIALGKPAKQLKPHEDKDFEFKAIRWGKF